MLKMDLAHLSTDQATDWVTKTCSKFGSVKGVNIFHVRNPEPYDFALVRMATPSESARLRTELGDSTFGDGVVIGLKQETQHSAA